MFKNLLAQQVLLAGAVRSIMAAAVGFGLKLTPEQIALLVGAVGSVGVFLNAWLYGVQPGVKP